jgi:cytoskeletal protein CcmA (bactofilin family)
MMTASTWWAGEKMDQSPNNQDDQTLDSSLETTDTVVEAPSSNGTVTPTPGSGPNKPHRSLREQISRLNIYLLIFILLLIAVGIFGAVLYFRDRQANNASQTISSKSLSTADLDRLANSGISVGDPKQILTVQSNAVFAGKMLVRSDLEVAGHLVVGNSLTLGGLNVAGLSSFDDVQISKSLSIGGNTAVQGKVTATSLAISGGASFGGGISAGQVTTNGLTLSGNLVLTHHIIIGGSSPSRSNGNGLGGGGTSSVSGSDSAGSITINTGNSPSVGCFITVNFSQHYDSTPRVIVTPVGSGAGQVGYYVTKNSSSFSVCGTSAAPSGASFGFDYFVVQ